MPGSPWPPYDASGDGRTILVTGKYTANAPLHVDHPGVDLGHVDHVEGVEGKVWGVGKADVLRRTGASIYVGDHAHDVEGARAAGTHVVLNDQTEFGAWLESRWPAGFPTE